MSKMIREPERGLGGEGRENVEQGYVVSLAISVADYHRPSADGRLRAMT
jgi:hypothetical protein